MDQYNTSRAGVKPVNITMSQVQRNPKEKTQHVDAALTSALLSYIEN